MSYYMSSEAINKMVNSQTLKQITQICSPNDTHNEATKLLRAFIYEMKDITQEDVKVYLEANHGDAEKYKELKSVIRELIT